MAWLPISGTVPQYSTSANELADNYYLKFYSSGTTTPINMATDSTGGTTLAKCALSAEGFPITNPLDDSTRFIPHIDQDYRIVLYSNETDADNNTTANAVFNIDGMVLQVAPSGDAADVTLRDTDIQTQDDYDRSPLFVDGAGFTAGAGPHTITVPSEWTPTNSDMRFYKVDASGIITDLTPTSTSSSDFTIAETLLSTDEVFIGDDTFRNQFRSRTLTKALDGSMAGAGSVKIVRIGDVVTLSAAAAWSVVGSPLSTWTTNTGFLPSWATPPVDRGATFETNSAAVYNVVCEDNGRLTFDSYLDGGGSTSSNVTVHEPFTISYVV